MTPQSLGERLAQLRREKAARDGRDVTSAEVAKAAGVSRGAMSRYEKNIDAPRDPVLAKIAAFLGTTMAYLRYGVTPHGPTLEDLDTLTPEEQQALLRTLIHPSAKTLTDAEEMARQSLERDEFDDRALAKEQREKKSGGRRR
jgi:transcriptional regulator with XRE-family HTH domain